MLMIDEWHENIRKWLKNQKIKKNKFITLCLFYHLTTIKTASIMFDKADIWNQNKRIIIGNLFDLFIKTWREVRDLVRQNVPETMESKWNLFKYTKFILSFNKKQSDNFAKLKLKISWISSQRVKSECYVATTNWNNNSTFPCISLIRASLVSSNYSGIHMFR